MPIGMPAFRAHFDLHFPGDIGPGQRVGRLHDVFGSAVRDQAAAVASSPGSQIDDIVGSTNRILIVLDHQHGVAKIAQVFERQQQAIVVAMMQSDRWFI